MLSRYDVVLPKDALGSIRALSDNSGQSSGAYSYDAFGTIRTQIGGIGNSFTFTGEQSDPESGLQFLRARYYDPETGRFLSQDQYPANTSDTNSLNRYLYAQNNPILLVDPSGNTVKDTANGSSFNYLSATQITDVNRFISLAKKKIDSVSGNLSKFACLNCIEKGADIGLDLAGKFSDNTIIKDAVKSHNIQKELKTDMDYSSSLDNQVENGNLDSGRADVLKAGKFFISAISLLPIENYGYSPASIANGKEIWNALDFIAMRSKRGEDKIKAVQDEIDKIRSGG